MIFSLATAAALGAVACWAWVSLLGLFTSYAWFPLFQHYWPVWGGDPSQSYVIASIFSAIFSAVVAVLFNLALCRLAASRAPHMWFAYTAGFLVCLAGPLAFDPMEGLIQFVLLSPDALSFLAASAISYWVLTKGAQRAVQVKL